MIKLLTYVYICLVVLKPPPPPNTHTQISKWMSCCLDIFLWLDLKIMFLKPINDVTHMSYNCCLTLPYVDQIIISMNTCMRRSDFSISDCKFFINKLTCKQPEIRHEAREIMHTNEDL
ncbi:unnamed protein product [Musa textilis]